MFGFVSEWQQDPLWYMKFVVTPCCFLNCVFLGPFYAWSVMVSEVDAVMGGNNGSYIISVIIFLSSLANVAMGRYVDRLGARKCILLGMVLTCAGLLVGGLSVRYGSLTLFYLGFGVLCGVGIGWAFLASLLMMIKWYAIAKRPGLAAGIFGLCIGSASTCFTYIDYSLLQHYSVEHVFYLLALIIALAPTPALVFFDFPVMAPAGAAKGGPAPAAPKPLSMGAIMARREFYLFFLANTLLLTPGWGVKVMVYPFQEDLFGVSARSATNVAAIFLASYSFGRFLFSMLADKISVTKIFVVFPFVNIVIFGALPWVISSKAHGEALFNVLTCLSGVIFAGAKSLFSVYLLKLWGPANLSAVTGMSLPSYGLAAVIGPISAVRIADSSSVVNDQDVYNDWFVAMAVGSAFSLLLMVQLGRVSEKGGVKARPRKSESEMARPSLSERASDSLKAPLLDSRDSEDSLSERETAVV